VLLCKLGANFIHSAIHRFSWSYNSFCMDAALAELLPFGRVCDHCFSNLPLQFPQVGVLGK
jgi:hypothetical protein